MGKRVRTGGARWLFVALMATFMLLGMTAAAYADSITGTVMSGGSPLDGVDVQLYDEYWNWVGTATTDGTGAYQHTDLPAGNYIVEFDPYSYNYWNGTAFLPEYWLDQPLWSSPDVVAVEFGMDTTGVDADLEVGGRIAGTVTENGVPLTDIIVSAYDSVNGFSWSEWTWFDGTYSIVAPVGSYPVQFDPFYYNMGTGAALPVEWWDDVATLDAASMVDVYAMQVTWDINADLGSTGGGGGGDISGRVTDEFGTGLEGIQVSAWGVDGMIGYDTATDPDGYYTLAGVQPDMSGYEVFFGPNNYNADNDRDFLGEFYNDTYDYWSRTLVQPGWSGVDAMLAEGGRITGTVTDALGQPAEGVHVTAQDWGDYYVDAWTDASGGYTLHGTFPDKTVYVSFDPFDYNDFNGTNYLAEWWDNAHDSDSATPLMGTASGIDAQLDEAVVLSGTVVDMLTGGPVRDVEVQVTDYDTGGWYGYAYTDENGAYSVNVPPNVDVRVYFDTYDTNWYWSTEYLSLFYNGSYMWDGAFRVSVGTDPVTVNQALPTGTSITGTVTTGGMEPGGYVWVEAYLQVDGMSAYSVATQSNWDGTYDFGPLFPGEWKVRFFDYVYDDGANPPVFYFGEWWDDKTDEASADLVWLDETGDVVCDADLAGEATVSGRVIDDYGMPVPNAIVTVWGADDMSGYDPGMSGYDPGMSGYWTDADGYFVVPAGMTGEVRVQVEPPYDRPELLGVWYSDKYDFGSADVVFVTNGEDTPLGDIVLHRGGTVSGMVTDEAGNPLDGIWVNLYGQTAGLSDYYRSAYTMSGYYEFVGLPALEAQLEFWPGEHNDLYDADLLGEYWNDVPANLGMEATPILVEPGLDLTADAQLAAGTRIAGVVRNEAGDPLPNVSVNANTSDGWGYGWAYTDENGAYVIRGLYPGSYQVSFEPWDYNWFNNAHLLSEFYSDAHTWDEIDWVDVAAGAPRLDIDAVLEAGGWIEGTVTDGGIPLAGVQVDVFDPVTGDYVGSGHTGFEGTYSTSALAQGEYLVRFDPWEQNDVNGTSFIFEYYDNARDQASASPVSVVVGNGTPGIDADLEVGGSLSGVVTDEFDMPLWGVTVTVFDADGQYAGEAWADPDTGEWTIKALVPGDYTLEFGPWMKNLEYGTSYLREYWDDKATKAEADPIAVDLGDVLTGYDAQLVQGGGTIGGTVTGPAGEPIVSDVWVHLLEKTADGADWFAYDVAMAPDGTYSISGLPAGTYYLWFEPDWVDYVDQVYDGKPMAGGEMGQDAAIARLATPVELTDGQVRNDVNVELQTGSIVSGSVVDPTDAGIPGVDVELFYSDGDGGWVPVLIETTDAEGKYTFNRVLAGDYKVEFADGQAWYLDAADIDAAGTVTVAANTPYELDPQQLPLPDIDPPTSTLTVTGGTMGQSGWYLAAPTLTLSADEPANLWYQWDGGMALMYSGALTPALGEHTLTYWAIDLEGNAESPKQTATFKFDDTAPSMPTGVSASQSAAGEATVSWTAATDAQSGIQRYVLYRWDGTTWQVVNHTIPSTSTSYVVTGLPGGIAEFQVAAVNMPGLSTTSATAAVDIDATAPTTTMSVSPDTPDGQNGWYISKPTITLTPNETVLNTTYHFGGANRYEYTGPFETGEGIYTVWGYSIDPWLNSESPGPWREFYVDLTPPPAVTDLAATVVNADTVNLTWTEVTDATSTLWRYAICDAEDDSTYYYTTGDATEVSGLAPDTDYTFYLLAQDNAGWFSGESNHVTIHTPPLNSRPVAENDSYTMAEDTVLTVAAPGVLGNDTDADGDPLTASFDGAPLHGEVTLNADGSFTYTPDPDWFGTDTFDYVASDGPTSDGATVTITVTDVAEPPAGLTVTKVEGTNRVGTAIEASKKAFADGSADTVVIATAMNWPDALGGAALAGAVKGPILLTNTNALPADVLTEIDRLGADRAYILGGTAAVGAPVEAALKTTLGAGNVTRLAGTGRYETARKTAAECVRVLGAEYDGTAFLATGANFPDALGASPLAAAKGWPIYLVNPAAGADAALVAAMKADGVKNALVLGGTGVVAERVKTDVAAKVPCTAARLAGDNRYDTAIAVATYGVDNARLGWDKVAIATGANFPDALAGGVLQGTSGSVMLLTPQNSLYGKVASTLAANKGDIHEIRFLGGTSAVSTAVRTAAVNALK